MSDDEEQLAIGRIVTDYKKAKQRLTALQSEATNIGQLMQRMGQSLTFSKPGSANFTPENFAKLDHEKICRSLMRFIPFGPKSNAYDNS